MFFNFEIFLQDIWRITIPLAFSSSSFQTVYVQLRIKMLTISLLTFVFIASNNGEGITEGNIVYMTQ